MSSLPLLLSYSHREELARVEAERVLLSNKVNHSDQELHQQRQLLEQQKTQVREWPVVNFYLLVNAL